jgi:hypothetical protein
MPSKRRPAKRSKGWEASLAHVVTIMRGQTLLRPSQGMLLKGDEGGAKFGGGVAENGDFRQGGHYPWMILALRLTGQFLTTQ